MIPELSDSKGLYIAVSNIVTEMGGSATGVIQRLTR